MTSASGVEINDAPRPQKDTHRERERERKRSALRMRHGIDPGDEPSIGV